MSNIECRYLSELDVNDKFFNSLREDYSNFTIPFNKSKRLKICLLKLLIMVGVLEKNL